MLTDVTILSTSPPWDVRSTELLNSYYTSKGPKIRVRDLGELGLDSFEACSCLLESSVGTVVGFRSESHSSTIEIGERLA